MTDKKTQVRSTEEALRTERALKLALEALEKMGRVMKQSQDTEKAITALREALMSVPDGAEQPAQQQEPVAWTSWRELAGARHYGTPGWVMHADKRSDEDVPLYTSPQPSKPEDK